MKLYKNLILVFFISIFGCSGGGGDDSPLAETKDTTSPSVPSNLFGTSTSTTSIDLNWTASSDNVGVKNYSIYQDNDELVTTSSITHTVSGLLANTAYAFKVKARDAAGNESDFSNSINVKTDDNTAILVRTSGNLETYLGNFIDGVPGSSGDDYTIPSSVQLAIWNDIVDAVLAENIDDAVLKSSYVNYKIN